MGFKRKLEKFDWSVESHRQGFLFWRHWVTTVTVEERCEGGIYYRRVFKFWGTEWDSQMTEFFSLWNRCIDAEDRAEKLSKQPEETLSHLESCDV